MYRTVQQPTQRLPEWGCATCMVPEPPIVAPCPSQSFITGCNQPLVFSSPSANVPIEVRAVGTEMFKRAPCAMTASDLGMANRNCFQQKSQPLTPNFGACSLQGPGRWSTASYDTTPIPALWGNVAVQKQTEACESSISSQPKGVYEMPLQSQSEPTVTRVGNGDLLIAPGVSVFGLKRVALQ